MTRFLLNATTAAHVALASLGVMPASAQMAERGVAFAYTQAGCSEAQRDAIVTHDRVVCVVDDRVDWRVTLDVDGREYTLGDDSTYAAGLTRSACERALAGWQLANPGMYFYCRYPDY